MLQSIKTELLESDDATAGDMDFLAGLFDLILS
jgi:hypothetical protein